MNLKDAVSGQQYVIKEINANDNEFEGFLFSLGCYSGEEITVISKLKGGCIVLIKNARYNIDNNLAKAILIEEK